MRVPNREARCIGYRLNILGVRVWKDRCCLVAKNRHGEWEPFGPPRALPLMIPTDPTLIGSDSLLLTAHQYHLERPGSDLLPLLAQTKDFDVALSEDNHSSASHLHT